LALTFKISDAFSGSLPLFYQKTYLSCQDYQKLVLVEGQAGKNRIFAAFNFVERQAISLPRALFGSFYFQGSIGKADFLNWHNELEGWLIKEGICEIIVTHPPHFYVHYCVQEWLKAAGYQIKNQEYNQFITLSRKSSLHPMEQRKIGKADQKDWQIEIENDWDEVFRFLYQNRKEQQIPLNIEKDTLLMLASKLTHQYQAWTLKRKDEWLALVVTAHILPETQYYFLPVTATKHRHDSPMAFLMYQLTRIFRKEGFTYFDLGISSIEGQLQTGLFNFKKRMGAEYTYKTTWVKQLANDKG
jgi:hypothetical protein